MTAPTFSEALRVWLRIGLTSFGGPAGQIALMHRLLVDERRWIDEGSFLRALNLCMLLPGPEAQQLATYIGWRLHGLKGGLCAGGLFILPGAIVMFCLSLLAVTLGHIDWVMGLFYGLQCVVLAVVAEAVQRLAKRSLKGRLQVAFAALAFIAVFFFGVPFPIVVLCAAAAGALLLKGSEAPAATLDPRGGGLLKAALTLVIGLGLWAAPLLVVRATLGADHVLWTSGLFFSKMAVVTFGGAYAVLTYVAQEAVAVHGWLSTGEMIQGLGLAETTPGPLILTLQYVGFLAGWRQSAPFDPLTGGVLASLMTLWVTFVPCFLWIFLIAPFMAKIERLKRLSSALAGITAAVTGVVLSLSLWFAVHVLFGKVGQITSGPLRVMVPDLTSLDARAVVIAALAAFALLRFHVGLLKVLAAGAVAGMALKLIAF